MTMALRHPPLMSFSALPPAALSGTYPQLSDSFLYMACGLSLVSLLFFFFFTQLGVKKNVELPLVLLSLLLKILFL